MSGGKVYHGMVDQGGWPGRVLVYPEKGSPYPLPHIVRHSPDGFAWGYGGSGPSDLALALLADALEIDPANVHDRFLPYMDFKFAVVARWYQDKAWMLTQDWIIGWYEDHRREASRG